MQMEDEMIERVAKAIRDKREMSLCDLCDGRRAMIRCTCRELAAVAIEAMKFPVGGSSVPGGLAIEESMFASEDTVFHGAAKCFNAILDEALSPSESTKKRGIR